MQQIQVNNGYKSVFEYILEKNGEQFAWFWQTFYPYEYARFKLKEHAPFIFRPNTKPKIRDVVEGALQPFVDVINEFCTYKQRYYSIYDFYQDALTPIKGLRNIASGILSICLSPCVSAVNLIRHALCKKDRGEKNDASVKVDILRFFAWHVDGVARSFKGLWQLVSTPLTYCVKIPLRCFNTLISEKKDFTQKREIQRLVKKGLQHFKDLNRKKTATIIQCLHEKAQEAIAHGESMPDAFSDEDKYFNAVSRLKASDALNGWDKRFSPQTTANLVKYFGLFVAKKDIPRTPTFGQVPSHQDLTQIPELDLSGRLL